ncbi:MAG: class I SAM-dependent methyltransferase [Anaerolineae bacterium]|nr:class I SAM-dependent methyltransferase [Anaerolineae bacterium]
MTSTDLYDKLAPYYHLIYEDWEGDVALQAAQLASIIKAQWGDNVQTILDVACGIGTQALGLAQRNYQVTASDLSPTALARARQEAEKRGLDISFSIADMRQAYTHHQQQFDVVIAGDNAVPHLLTDDDILQALQQFFQCTRPGGGLILTVRDYDQEERSGIQLKPEGVRIENGQRDIVFQVWAFQGDVYELSIYIVNDKGGGECVTQVMRGHYYAIGADKLMKLMIQAGFEQVTRLDDVFFQPVLIGTKSGAHLNPH